MNVCVITLGCPKNSVDSDEMISVLKHAGYTITNEQQAEIIIVNTCSFLCTAREEAVQTILEAAQLKQEELKLLCVSGCLVSQRWSKDIQDEFHEVDIFIPVGKHMNIAEYLEPYTQISSAEKTIERTFSVSHSYAYLKIAEGCNNFCSYCLIPEIRGRVQCRTSDDIIDEAQRLAEQGVKELIIVAQDVSQWQEHSGEKLQILQLLEKISSLSLFHWIRVLYVNPFHLNREFFKRIAGIENVVHYIDIPFQHIDDSVLKRMNRNVTEYQLRDLVTAAREQISDICFRTTFITGFPGETEQQYQKMYDFVQETRFDKCGFFPYSDEQGTAAFSLKPKISDNIIVSRLNSLVELQHTISEDIGTSLIGKSFEVLVEDSDVTGTDLGFPSRSFREAPDIDGYIFLENCKQHHYGTFVNAKITDSLGADLIGEIIE